ncbi:MAG TPA: hypothetical protein PK493_10630 [Pseudomonadota bacterium]|nr:hypothetical protein [Pseudomonadota bacterium]
MGNEDRPKLSWREIDKRRAGGTTSTGRGTAPSERPHHEEATRQKQYRAALEAAFAKGELGKLADKLNLTGRSTPAEEPKPVAPASPPPAAAPAAAASDGKANPAEAAAPAEGGKKTAAKKKPTEDKASLLRKLAEAVNRQEISRAAEKYLARFPIPDDHEFLEQLLEHEKESRIREAMTRIGELLDKRHLPKRTRALIGKLRYLTETNPIDDIRELAKTLLSRLT